MTYADTTERTHLIAGLRALADFLEGRPPLPAPAFADITVFPAREDDLAMRAEIDRVAALLDTPSTTAHGHYETGRDFGPVSYRAVAVLSDARARWDTVTKITDAVVPIIATGTRGKEIDLGPSCACGARVEDGSTVCRKCASRLRWQRRKARRTGRRDEGGQHR